MNRAEADVWVEDLRVLPPDGYRELIEGRLIGVPGISIDLLLTLDRKMAARAGLGPADDTGPRPAVIFVGPLPPVDYRTVDPADLFAVDPEAEEREFQTLLQGARIYAAPGLRHWWWVELDLGGNLRLVAYSADSFAFP